MNTLLEMYANIYRLRVLAADARESGLIDAAAEYERQLEEAQAQFDQIAYEVEAAG